MAGALIAAGSVAGAWAGLASDDTRTVAVLAADLPAGHVITSGDVASVDLEKAEGLRLLTPDAVEGMALTRPVPAGSPLVAGSVSDSALWPDPGQAVVAVPVTTVPQDLEEGTTVDLITTQVAQSEAAEAEEGAEGTSGVVTGLVHRVLANGDGFGGGQQVVEVILPREQIAHFSRAAAGGGVQVSVVNPHEEARVVAEEGERG